MTYMTEAAVFLLAAVTAVPLARRLGLGAVLGYVAAGLAIGPAGLGLIDDVDGILHFAELGVVLLLFIIGLELQPSRLWKLRRAVFGLGTAQVAATTAALALAAWLMGMAPTAAVVIGLALSLSSTAFALQTLAERGELTTRHGRSAFALLLFQDLAVIPVLALLPLLGDGAATVPGSSLLPGLAQVAVTIAVVVVGGRYLLRHVLRAVAASRSNEIFTAMALLTVLGTALVMEFAGLSMALGAFLAGMLLADSEYRHQLEADIEPFKGLLLGLFFIAVGMSVNAGLLFEQPVRIVALACGLLAVKAAILFVLGRLHGLDSRSARLLAATVPQGGEFAFVIFGVAVGAGIMIQAQAQVLIMVVILSMALTPLVLGGLGILERRLHPRGEPPFDRMPEQANPVIIAGFGRVGQIVARILAARRTGFTALEVNPDQVDFVRRYGNRIYYGDATRLDLLRAAGADEARFFVLAIDDVQASLRTAELVRRHFPHLKVYARARNRKHAYQLMDLGIELIRRETLLSSLELARELLRGLGLSASEARDTVETFRRHDERRLLADHSSHNDEQRMIYLSQRGAEELEKMFEQDAAEEKAPPPRKAREGRRRRSAPAE